MNNQQLLKTFLQDTSQKNKLNLTLESYLKDVEVQKGLKRVKETPFSSDRKYSAVEYQDQTLVLGAPEMLLSKGSKEFKDVQNYTKESFRVVVFGTKIKELFHALAVIALDDPTVPIKGVEI